MPTLVEETIGTLGGEDYASEGAWEVATGIDLVAADEIREGQFTEIVTGTAGLTVSGATPDATRFRRLAYAPGLHYDPKTDTGAGLTGAVAFGLINCAENFFQMVGILYENTYGAATTSTTTIRVNSTADGVLLDEMTVKRSGGADARGAAISFDFDAENFAILRNSDIMSDGTGSLQGLSLDSKDTKVQAVNVYDFSDDGIENTGSVTQTAVFEVTNTISMGSGNEDFDVNGGGVGKYTFCGSEDATADPFASSFDTVTVASVFTDAGAGDLTLVAAGPAVGTGKDLSGSFTNDNQGLTRDLPFDMGAHKFVAALVPGSFLRPEMNVHLRR